MGDDVTVTLQTDLEGAIAHLPEDRRGDMEECLAASGLDGSAVRLHELFRTDPDLG